MIRFATLSLFRDDSGAVVSNASDNYLGIDPNAIAVTFSDLYDRELNRSLGGIKPAIDSPHRDWTHFTCRLGEVISRFHGLKWPKRKAASMN